MEISKEFTECYQYFNVYDMTEKVKSLTDKEKYLLLICTLDEHNDEDPIVLNNYREFEEELQNILDLHEGEEVKTEVLKTLSKKFGDKHIPISSIKLPKIFTKEEAREVKLNNILEK